MKYLVRISRGTFLYPSEDGSVAELDALRSWMHGYSGWAEAISVLSERGVSAAWLHDNAHDLALVEAAFAFVDGSVMAADSDTLGRSSVVAPEVVKTNGENLAATTEEDIPILLAATIAQEETVMLAEDAIREVIRPFDHETRVRILARVTLSEPRSVPAAEPSTGPTERIVAVLSDVAPRRLTAAELMTELHHRYPGAKHDYLHQMLCRHASRTNSPILRTRKDSTGLYVYTIRRPKQRPNGSASPSDNVQTAEEPQQ